MSEALAPERRMAEYEDAGAALYDEWCRLVYHNKGADLEPAPVAWAYLHPAQQAGWKVLAEREARELRKADRA